MNPTHDAKQFLETLGRGPGGLQELRIPRAPWTKRQFFFRVEDFEDAADFAIDQGGSVDIFVGVGVRGARRGRAHDVIRVAALWAELDGDLEAADVFPLPDSIRVASGSAGHEHRYWLLDEPFDTTKPLARSRWERVNKALARYLGADNCFDLPRVMRVPGTINHKNGALVELLHFNVEAVYRLGDFEELLPVREEDRSRHEPVSHERTPISALAVKGRERGGDWATAWLAEHRTPDIDQLEVAPTIKGYILAGARVGMRSGTDWRVAKALVRAGCTDEEVVSIFASCPVGDKARASGWRYLERTLARARAYRSSLEASRAQKRLILLPRIVEVASANDGLIVSQASLAHSLSISKPVAAKHLNRAVEEGVLREVERNKKMKSYELIEGSDVLSFGAYDERRSSGGRRRVRARVGLLSPGHS